MFKKINKILFVVSLFTFALTFIQVYAQTPMKIETKSYIVTGSRNEAKFKTNKGYAYCITPDRIGAAQGASLTYMSSEDKGGVLYLLEKAGTSDHDYLVTQLAIWIYKFNYMPDYYVNNSSIEVVKSAKSLAADASKHNNYSSSIPNYTFAADKENMQLTSDGKYYKSSITIRSSIANKEGFKVELQDSFDGVKINKVNGNNNNVIYEITVPVEKVTVKKTFKVRITDYYNINNVERYTPGDGHQDLVVLVPIKKTYTKDITLNVSPVVRKCEIYNNQYYGTNGSIVTKEEYETQCLHKCQRIGDKYYDQEGKETTAENYQIQCFKHNCEKIGDKYFGKDGFEVSQSEYTKQCVHTCEIYNNEYYDSNGYKVSEAEYKSQCEAKEVVVPDTKTSSAQSVFFLIIGSCFLGTVLGYIEYRNKKVLKVK